MSTPKQKRKYNDAPLSPEPLATGETLLDDDFDGDEADQEFSRWRWPERDT